MKQYVMAIDQGTTSCRCILFDERAEPVSFARKEFRQIYPAPGWVEHDPWGSGRQSRDCRGPFFVISWLRQAKTG